MLNKKRVSRALEFAMAAALVVALAYLISTILQVSSGVSRVEASPAHKVRLQILDGCDSSGPASRLAGKLDGWQDGELAVAVVAVDRFDVTEVSRTILIARDRDKSAAALLAGRLGLDRSRVVIRPLEANYRHISATLVVGCDFEEVMSAGNLDKEA